jgi:pyrroloquinoline-quinone synthase
MTQQVFDRRRFKQIVTHHKMWRHPFLVRCRSSTLSRREVETFALQAYMFSREFVRFLGAIMMACEDEEARLIIAENLWDEMGGGQAQLTHPTLFRRFTRALGYSDEQLEATVRNDETSHLVNTYLNAPIKHGYVPALGALCYASEGLVGTLYTQIASAILATAAVPKEALLFFELHVGVDDGHAQKLESIVSRRVTTEAEAEAVAVAVTEALDARYRFFDGVERAITGKDEAASSKR